MSTESSIDQMLCCCSFECPAKELYINALEKQFYPYGMPEIEKHKWRQTLDEVCFYGWKPEQQLKADCSIYKNAERMMQ